MLKYSLTKLSSATVESSMEFEEQLQKFDKNTVRSIERIGV